MDSLVNDDEVVTSSGDTAGNNNVADNISHIKDNRERIVNSPAPTMTALSGRTLNGTVLFTSVSSPSAQTSIKTVNASTVANTGGVTNNKHSAITNHQTITVPQSALSFVQLLPNQTNVAQSVIQPPNQQSVIQAPGGTSLQAVQMPRNVILVNKTGQGSVIQSTTDTNNESVALAGGNQSTAHQLITREASESVISTHSSIEDGAKIKREILARRPSYRKIFNDLSSADVGSISRIDDDIKSDDELTTGSDSSSVAALSAPSPTYMKVVPTSAIQLTSTAQENAALSTLAMANAAGTGNTILQYATSNQDSQLSFVPMNVSAADLQAYQIRPAGGTVGLSQSVVMTAPSNISPTPNTEDAQRKREIRLQKNREAAKECRRKKKEYIKCLENRVTALEDQNKTLINELNVLKDTILYSGKSD